MFVPHPFGVGTKDGMIRVRDGVALLDGDGGGGGGGDGDGDGDAGGGNGGGGGGDGDGDGGGDGGEAERQFQSNHNVGVNENIRRFAFSAELVRLKGSRQAAASVARACHVDSLPVAGFRRPWIP